MQIMIDIPEEEYKRVMDGRWIGNDLADYIEKGTPLPKGCGDLIDRKPIYDSLIRSYRADKKDYPERGKEYRVGLSNAIDLLNAAPTIIEADTESEGKK